MAWYPLYASVAEVRAFNRIPAGDTTDDTQIGFAVEAASRSIDIVCGRQFGVVAAPEARFYNVLYLPDGREEIQCDDFQSLTGLVVALDTNRDGTYALTLSNSTLVPNPYNALVKNRPYQSLFLPRNLFFPVWPDGYFGQGNLLGPIAPAKVTALWGWTAVPDTVKQATLIQASRFLKRRDAPFGVAGSPDLGNELRLLRDVDVDVATALGPYRRQSQVWGA